jgi:hypothetical protein
VHAGVGPGLDLDVRDFKLGTLTAWANIRQLQAHSAVDDVRVLESIFRKLMEQAVRGQVTLPMSANTAAVRQPYGERAPSISSPWEPAGAWTDGTPLVQGMKFVITGGTRTPRGELYATGINAGLTPMNSVSTKTSLLVCNDPNLLTRKASRGRRAGDRGGHRGAFPPYFEPAGRGSSSQGARRGGSPRQRRRRRARSRVIGWCCCVAARGLLPGSRWGDGPGWSGRGQRDPPQLPLCSRSRRPTPTSVSPKLRRFG